MKRIFVSLFFFGLAFLIYLYVSTPSKENKVFVYDFEHDFTQGQIKRFDSLFKEHEKKTTNEIALVTTNGYGSDKNILFYSVNFGREQGIGKADKKNGIIIAFSSKRLETNISTGYGIEEVLKDEITRMIIDSLIVPELKQGNTFEAFWAGSKAIIQFLEKPENKIN